MARKEIFKSPGDANRMRWNLLLVRLGILAINLVIVAILLLSFVPLALNGMDVSLPDEDDVEWTFHDNVFLLSAPLEIYNGGYYDIEDLSLAFSVRDGGGDLIADSTSTPVDLIAGEENTVNLILALDLDEVDEEFVDEMIFENTTLDMRLDISAKYMMSLMDINVHASHEFEMPALVEDYGVRTEEISYSDGNLSIPYWISTSDMVSGTEFGLNLTVSAEEEIATASDVIELNGHQEGVFLIPISEEDIQDLMDDGEVTITLELDYQGIKASREFSYSLSFIRSFGIDTYAAYYDEWSGSLRLPYWVDSADLSGSAELTCSVWNSTATIGSGSEYIGLGYNHTGEFVIYISTSAMEELVTTSEMLDVVMEIDYNGLGIEETYQYGWEAPILGHGVLNLDVSFFVNSTFEYDDYQDTYVYVTVYNDTGVYLGSGSQYVSLIGNTTGGIMIYVYDAGWLETNDATLVLSMSFSCYGVSVYDELEMGWEAPL
jgi:hypothetical protein